MSYDPSMLYSGRHALRCAHCGKTLEGGAVPQPTYRAIPAQVTPKRLGHACPKCGAVSCHDCNKAGIGLSGGPGYENTRCSTCDTSADGLHVLLPGAGEAYRVYDNRVAADVADAPAAPASGSASAGIPDATHVAPQRFAMAGNVRLYWDSISWLVILGGMVAMYLFLIAPSEGQFDFEHPALVVLAPIVGFGALFYNFRRISRRRKQWLEVDDTGIRSQDVSIAWNDVDQAYFAMQQGDETVPAVVLRDTRGQQLCASWGLKGIDRLTEVVRTKTRPEHHRRTESWMTCHNHPRLSGPARTRRRR